MTEPGGPMPSIVQTVTAVNGFAYGVIGADIHVHGNGAPLYLLANWQGKPDPARADWLRELPSRMLNTRRALVPFTGRDRELAELRGWRDDIDTHLAVRWLHGPGGQGKTRLAAQFVADSAAAGWQVVAASHGPDADRPTPGSQDLRLGGATGLLLIVDYADRWLMPNLTWLFNNALVNRKHVPTRVLMLARSADPWPRICGILDAVQASTSTIELGSLGLGSGDRIAMFTAARDGFAAVYDAAANVPADPPDALRHPEFGLVLAVHMAALVAVSTEQDGAGRPATTDVAGLTAYLLNREQLHWARRYTSQRHCGDGTYPTPPEQMARIVFVAALTGSMHRADGAALLRRVMTLPDSEHALTDHAACYPAAPENVLQPLYPDRLAEDYLALSLIGHEVDHPPQAWAEPTVRALMARDDDGRAPAYTARAITMLASAAQRWPHVGQFVLTPLLNEDPRLAVEAGSAGLTALATAPSVDTEVFERIHPVLRAGGRVFALDVGLADLSERLTEHRLKGATTDTRRALLHGEHGSSLTNAGRYDEALDEIREEVRLWERLAADHPDVFEQRLAAGLDGLATVLDELGRHDEALAADQRSTAIWQRHTAAEPRWAPAYARALVHLSFSLAATGRRRQALNAAEQAVHILRTIDLSQNTAYRDLMASAWGTLGNRQAESGKLREALTSAQRCADLWQEAVADAPNKRLELARALGNLQLRLAAVGRRMEATELAEQVVNQWRQLTELNRAAFEPELAKSLDHLSLDLAKSGESDRAAGVRAEAIEIYRRLTTENPAAHETSLAGALDHLASLEMDRGEPEAALAANQQAIAMYERQAQRRPELPPQELAKALDNQGIFLAALDRHQEALVASRRGTDLLGNLARVGLAGYDADHARALHNLSWRYAAVGRIRDALENGERAITIRRRLAERDPSASEPDLARSLLAFAILCHQAGVETAPNAAQAAADEAGEIYRRLAATPQAGFDKAIDIAWTWRRAIRHASPLAILDTASADPERRHGGMRHWFRKKLSQSQEKSSPERAPDTVLQSQPVSDTTIPALPPGLFGRSLISGQDLNEFARELLELGQRTQALGLWKDLANNGDGAAAANLIIECAADGLLDEALDWWHRAVELGIDVPPHDPGLRLRVNGRNRAAESWWRVAAEKLHDDRSCEYLGISLRERQEYDTSAHWLRQGADRGDGACARELSGLLLLRAENATEPQTRDMLEKQAVAWARKAAANGDDRAQQLLEQMRDEE